MTFKSTRNSFIIAIGVIGLLYAFFGISLGWLALPGAIFLILLIYGSAIIQANFFVQAYCYAHRPEKEIALSFDDGPHREYTRQVLSTLAEYKAPATFFRGREKHPR